MTDYLQLAGTFDHVAFSRTCSRVQVHIAPSSLSDGGHLDLSAAQLDELIHHLGVARQEIDTHQATCLDAQRHLDMFINALEEN